MRHTNANQLLSALSLALDIAENQPFEHAQRTAYIALLVAKEMNLPEEQLSDIYTASLLHDIGKTTSKLDFYKDTALVISHCQIGAEILKTLPFSATVVDYVMWHHANWDGNSPFNVSGDNIPLGAQIVYLADQVDIMLRELNSCYSDRSIVHTYVKSSRGKLFNPLVADAFISAQSREKFWLDYFSPYLSTQLQLIQPTVKMMVCSDLLELIANTFATIIDNKSSYTFDHSKGVTNLAMALGIYYDFSLDELEQLKISTLLHDLGKLAIPNSILDKPGKLTAEEFLIIKSHPYYTKLILSKIEGFDTIKEWAGNHHETLNGKGYPESISNLTLPEQIVSICDIYQALTEERPYRNRLPNSKALEIIADLVSSNKFSKEVFQDMKKILGF